MRHVRPISTALSSDEEYAGLMLVVKSVQHFSFPDIFADLANSRSPNQPLKLTPFVHSDGILRVGGRLSNSELTFSAKHPALLPPDHPLTILIIRQIHYSNPHPGINTTLYLMQQNFWILGARKVIRRVISNCYKCFRQRPSTFSPQWLTCRLLGSPK